jgi:uridylate kinase
MKAKLKYKRILLKISGEVLEGKLGQGIDFKVLDGLCAEIAGMKAMGAEIAIVIGGGNFWRYRDFKDSGLDHVHSDYMGMISTVMNSIAMRHSFRKLNVDACALSSFPMQQVVGTYLRDKALKYLEDGKIVICGGGTGNPYFTTDSAAALRALELQCNVLLKATKVDYVYDKDPVKYKNAKSFKKISYDEVFQRELGVMDLSAVDLCAAEKLPIVVFNLTKKGNIAKVVKGEAVGTIIN